MADAIVALHEERDGLFSREDLADYAGRFEEPLRGRFRGYEVLTNGPWTQGIVVPMALQILDGLPLEELGHNSPAYLHTVIQALELSMAGREAYVGDPDFVDVPVARLLDPGYAATRRAAMTERAFGALPAPGDAAPGRSGRALPVRPRAGGALAELARIRRDTSYLAVIDAAGNSVSMTPSDFPISPMVPGWGLTLGTRMTQFPARPQEPDRARARQASARDAPRPDAAARGATRDEPGNAGRRDADTGESAGAAEPPGLRHEPPAGDRGPSRPLPDLA